MSVFSRPGRKLRQAVAMFQRYGGKFSHVQPSGRSLAGVAAAALSAVALGVIVAHFGGGGVQRYQVPDFIEEGAVCKSLSDPQYEVSCGTTAFGDVRFDCSELGKCPTTTAVTLRNVGRVPVTLAMVGGRREGDRQISPAVPVAPEQAVTLRLNYEEKYFFDILVRSVKTGVGVVKVVAID
ncbi:hypothetical protein ACIBAC_41900 [Streptomyces sp. NPDC051362]|uniref:hypothetical protein n=1 Tax=Streptomyces sp. NPDC051362 TaxID=3365651 RepID=UPI003793CD85